MQLQRRGYPPPQSPADLYTVAKQICEQHARCRRFRSGRSPRTALLNAAECVVLQRTISGLQERLSAKLRGGFEPHD